MTKDIVIFRKWEGEIIALFPTEIQDPYHGYCLSYEHIGQHGDADYNYIISKSTPATPAEYQDLKIELQSGGYDLQVRQRRPNWSQIERR